MWNHGPSSWRSKSPVTRSWHVARLSRYGASSGLLQFRGPLLWRWSAPIKCGPSAVDTKPAASKVRARGIDEDGEGAIAIANNSRYGLSGAVFSQDLEHALEVAKRIESGTVELNGLFTGWSAPYGGMKESGIGREAGPEGFEAYVNTKSISLPSGLWRAWAHRPESSPRHHP